MNMQEHAELKNIRKNLSEQDNERISKEVERLEASHINPLEKVLAAFEPDEHTKAAVEWLLEYDVDFPEELALIWSKILTRRVEAEHVIEISRAIHREAA